MRYLEGQEKEWAMKSILKAAEIAQIATCSRSRCGSIIVNYGKIIGMGVNSPAYDLESQRRCENSKADYHVKVTDKTCCVHAEQRAIMNALVNYPNMIEGSRLYFIRLDENGELSFEGKPYCTICSKMALDAGVKEFVMYHSEGICVYDADEYNNLSYEYN